MPAKKASKSSNSAAKLRLLHRRRLNILGSAMLIKDFNRAFDPAHQDQLATQIALLDELWSDFRSTQEEIEVLEDSGEDFSEERRDFQVMYLQLKASLQSKLPAVPPQPPRAPVSVCAQPALPITNVRLPEIKIPVFGGNIDEWVSFRDLYVSLIHSNQLLTAVQKMHYLRASLSDEASRIISALDVSADDYQVAWNILKDRYENPNMLIKRHMSALLAITPLMKESAAGLSELADSFDRHVQLLNKLETAEDHWNSFLVERLSSCLDHGTLREWETHVDDGERPTYKELLEFIHKKSRIIKTLMLSHPNNIQSEPKSSKPHFAAHVASENVKKCPHCKQAHFLFQCSGFHDLIPQQRFEFVKKHGLCINCLKGTHLAKDCSSGSCKQCSKKHHTLLHLPPISSTSVPGTSAAAPIQSTPALVGQSTEAIDSQRYQVSPRDANAAVRLQSANSGASPLANSSSLPQSFSVGIAPSTSSVDAIVSGNNSPPSTSCQSAEVTQCVRQGTVVLSTAVIKVKDADNNEHFARALLDSGSQPSFITESLCQKLRLKRVKLNSPVSGIGQSTVNVHFGVTLSLASRFGNHRFTLDCLVLPKLTVSLPSHHIDVTRWRIPRNLPMADPQFNISQHVDIIIGAELFYSLLECQQISLAAGCPLLQKTVLGYVVCGKVMDPALDPPAVQTSHICTDDSLDKQLERSREIGNAVVKAYIPEEQRSEAHFQQTVSRAEDARFIVRLPLREKILPMFGDSYPFALRRLQSMEKKFAVDDGLREAHHTFERLGHMEEVNPSASRSPQFSLSRHAIQRLESTATKTQVVFDGSCRRSTNWLECVVSTSNAQNLQQEAYAIIYLHSATVGSSLFDRMSDLAKLVPVVARYHRLVNNTRLPRSELTIGSLTPGEGVHALKILVRELRLQDPPSVGAIPTSKPPLKDMTLTVTTIRRRFWPVRVQQLARKVVHQCVTRFRCHPMLVQQIMAPLPSVRVSPAKPCMHSGMDYCGPLLVRLLSGRGASVKVYVEIFVCLVVKVVHLEVVADLSSVAHVNAVKRFVARRGRVLELHCDNATAFVGADRELRTLREELRRQFRSQDWENFRLESGIKFRFIPARSPYFGGIWEVVIKSFKHPFRRIMGNRSFTVDQLQTAGAHIESVLNSRPLSPLTDSPDVCSALTTGHFLVGEPLVATLESSLIDVNPNRVSCLQEMKRSRQDLWRCWQLDNVSQLQQRTMWKQTQPDVRSGHLVMVKQATAPPLQWPLGQIIETVAANDGRVRVVVVKTASGSTSERSRRSLSQSWKATHMTVRNRPKPTSGIGEADDG